MQTLPRAVLFRFTKVSGRLPIKRNLTNIQTLRKTFLLEVELTKRIMK